MTVGQLDRTPFQKIQIDYAGLERFSYDVADKRPEDKVKIGHHWILPSPLSGMTHFRLKDGPLTVARFDGDFGNYKLAMAYGHYGDALVEACKFIPGLEPVRLNGHS